LATAKELADSLTARSGGRVRVTIRQVATAIGRDRLTGRQKVEESEDEVWAKLLEIAPEMGALVSDDVQPKSKDAEAEKPSGAPTKQTGAALVWTPEANRQKTRQDEEDLEWMQAVVTADKALRHGSAFRPHFERVGLRVRYVDPMQDFLEPHERNSQEDGTNYIYIQAEELELYMSDPAKHFRWRSNEILRKFERKLAGLWLAKRLCRGCHQEMVRGLRKDVKDILAGKKYLPETKKVPRHLVFRYPDFHPWCVSIRAEYLDLQVALQDYQGSDEEAIAFRTQYLIDMVDRVFQKHREDDITQSDIVKALRENMRVLKEAADRARS
jgi:hypothetical protein